MTLFGQSLIPPTITSSKKLINRSLAKLLELNTRLPADNFSLTDVVGDKATLFFAESILSEIDADNDTIKNREAVEDFELPNSDVQKADDAEVMEDRNQEQFFASRSCKSSLGREGS